MRGFGQSGDGLATSDRRDVFGGHVGNLFELSAGCMGSGRKRRRKKDSDD